MKNNNEEAINSVNNKTSNKGLIITIIVVGVAIVGSILTFGILYFQQDQEVQSNTEEQTKPQLDICLESAHALPESVTKEGGRLSSTTYPRKNAIDKCYREN